LLPAVTALQQSALSARSAQPAVTAIANTGLIKPGILGLTGSTGLIKPGILGLTGSTGLIKPGILGLTGSY
jgi:hypothetical protein